MCHAEVWLAEAVAEATAAEMAVATAALLDALLVTLSPETLERQGSSRGTVSGPWPYKLKSGLGNRFWFSYLG
jgi:hypothetical protein